MNENKIVRLNCTYVVCVKPYSSYVKMQLIVNIFSVNQFLKLSVKQFLLNCYYSVMPCKIGPKTMGTKMFASYPPKTE